MSRDDREEFEGDLRLRSAARASLARLATEVDTRQARREFEERLDRDPTIVTAPAGSRPLARRLVGVAVLLLLVVAAAAVLSRRDANTRTATVVPNPTGTTVEDATSAPSTTVQSSHQAPSELVALLGRTWVITTMDGQPSAFAAYFTMESGKATGHDGCNFYDSTIQVEGIAGGATSLQVTSGESTAAACVPPHEAGWSAPTGRYLVDGDSLTITTDDGTTFDAVDLDWLPTVGSAAEIIGEWSVPDGPEMEFVDDGTIGLPCANIGTWAFTDALHTTLDQAAATAGCTSEVLRSLSWTFDDMLSGAPTVRRLPDGSLLFGASQLGHIVQPTATPAAPTPPAGELIRPFVDPTACAPLSVIGDGDTIGSTFDLHLFAWPTSATSFPIQIIGDPTGGPTAPFALVQRYPDQNDIRLGQSTTINDWDVAIDVRVNDHGVVTGDARWALPDGGEGYVRSRGIDRDSLVAVIASLTTRDPSATIPGFDYTPAPTVPATLQLLVEHLNTGVYGRGASLLCAGTNFIYRISTLDGDAVFLYASVIDRPVPLEVAYKQGTLVVIEGSEDPTAPKVSDVFNADADTWNNLLAKPPG
jgi:heat shock protein HslJ